MVWDRDQPVLGLKKRFTKSRFCILEFYLSEDFNVVEKSVSGRKLIKSRFFTKLEFKKLRVDCIFIQLFLSSCSIG